MLITLSDGTKIDVPMTGDVEGGSDYDVSGALNARGYFDLKDPGLDWFRQTGQGNFSNPTDYWKWVYGGGDVVSGPNGQQYFHTPNGLANVVNQPLDYNEQEFADIAWMIPVAIATGGLAAGALGAGGAAGLEGAVAGAGAEFPGLIGAGEGAFGGATAGAGSGLGGGMFEDFFGDILGNVDDFSDPNIDFGNWFDDQLTNFDDLGTGGGTDWWKNLKNLFGGDSSGGGNFLGGLFGNGGLGDLFGSAISLAPSLAAIEYAKNTAPFDTTRLEGLYGSDIFGSDNPTGAGRLRSLYNEFDPSDSTRRLRSLYNQYDPEALAYTYDVNTGTGRERLTSNLARRGLSGSSFGNADIQNFDTGRDLGRQQLINQGAGLRADIARGIGDLDLRGTQMQYDIGRGISDIGLRDRALDLQGVKTQADIAGDITKFQALDRQYKNQLYSAALLALSGGLRR